MESESAVMIHSNLGGMGGPGCNATTVPPCPPEIYIANVHPNLDVVVRNETPYRPWNSMQNRLTKTAEFGVLTGTFATINLLAPRSAGMHNSWPPFHDITFVQLRIGFVDAATGVPTLLARTFFTFYDLDAMSPL